MTNNNNNDEHDLIAQRRAKLAELREKGNAYPNDFRRDSLAANLHAQYDQVDNDRLQSEQVRVKVAGRMMTRRIMGKASFAHIQDMTGRIQLYVKREDLPEGTYDDFKHWDIGDILGVEGYLFKTKTGELSIHVESIRLLAKSLRPLPEKFHGLTDTEARYRQRYLDLIMNEDSRRVFETRSRVIDFIRNYLTRCGFIEVETPMMHVIPGGATAKPFKTHHNALDLELFLRIAPELFLKRLIVGGVEKVFEINRSFRNEGLSQRHNPEFSMLEFYEAYADCNDLMNLIEFMLRSLVMSLNNCEEVEYQERKYDFSKPFDRMTLFESILHFNPGVEADHLQDLDKIRTVAAERHVPIEKEFSLGKIQLELFEKTVESKLLEPVYITAFPTEVSPLARRNDHDPDVTDRFELFLGGREIANGFSELNDPDDQAERFRKQLKYRESGDEEAMHYDADYIMALEYGMPPTAGAGVGIDRLVMFLTDSPTIRDVILFPHLRPRD